MDLRITTRVEGEHTVLHVEGDIDVHTAPQLRYELFDLVESDHKHLVVDLTEVSFLDSTGLGALVGGLKRTRAHDGDLQLAGLQEPILKIFQITGLTRVFSVHTSVADALAAPVHQFG